MATLEPSEHPRMGYDKCCGSAMAANIAPYRSNDATENHIPSRGDPRAETTAAAPRNSSTFYKTYLDPNIKLLGDQDYIEADNNGYTCLPGIASAQSLSASDVQHQAGNHAGTCKLAVRLANRTHGAPLATIIEQGSYSTLNSRGSLLSVGRFPSTKAAETTSPDRGSRRRSRSLDEKALHDVQGDLAREYDIFVMAVPKARLDEEHDGADSGSGTATPTTIYRFGSQRSTSGYSRDELLDHDDGNVKGFIRGVLRNVRGVSEGRSRSSTSTHAPTVEHRSSSLSPSGSSPNSDQQGQITEYAYLPRHSRDTSTHSCEAAVAQCAIRDQTRSRAMPSSSVDFSARPHLCPIRNHSEVARRGINLDFLPPACPCPTATCSYERFCSTPVVHAGTRGVAQDDGVAQASTSHHDMSGTSVQYTLDGIPIYRGHMSSNRELSSERDAFTSQNASFCSTMSTSYSGTVLGVDLDLQHDFTRPIRRSQSPPTPVWFTPQMAELERLASSSGSPELERVRVAPQGLFHSITSSALASLLPIAAATGIVQPDYNMPTISFHSPSGNLIQPQSSSPRSTTPLETHCNPTITTSYYNRHAVTPAQTRPPRRSLKPMNTPPTQRTPLPLHLRHHHNYHQPEMPHLSSPGVCFAPRGPVKGCDGVVREDSLTPRSGVFYPRGKDKLHRSTKLIMHDLKTEAKFYKARFLATAAAQSFVPSMPKGMTLKKRHLQHYDAGAKELRTANAKAKQGELNSDPLGSLAARTLRVCFCQPYDGAGGPTRATAARSCMAGESLTMNSKFNEDQNAKDVEQLLPNARVATKQRHSRCGDTKRATRSDSALSRATQRASYTSKTKSKHD